MYATAKNLIKHGHPEELRAHFREETERLIIIHQSRNMGKWAKLYGAGAVQNTVDPNTHV